MNNLKKTVSVVLVGAMALSAVACSKQSKEEKEIIDLATEYSDALLAGKTKDVVKLSDIDKDDKDSVSDSIARIIEFEGKSSETQDALMGFVNYIDYSVAKKTAEVEGNKGSIEVTFTMPDYEELDEEDFEDADEYLDALEGYETVDVTVKMKFKINKKDEWVCTNYEDVIEKVFEFSTEYAPGFCNFDMPSYDEAYDAFEDNCYYAGDSSTNSYSYIYAYDDDYYMWANYYVYNSASDARESFEGTYYGYMDDNKFDGKMEGAYNGDTGYILIDGDSYKYDSYYYSAIFYDGNTVMYVSTTSQKDKIKDNIDDILEDLDLPTPSSLS